MAFFGVAVSVSSWSRSQWCCWSRSQVAVLLVEVAVVLSVVVLVMSMLVVVVVILVGEADLASRIIVS